MPRKRDPRPSLSVLIGDLWCEAARQPKYQEHLWQELVALAPALEVRGPMNTPPDVQIVQHAMALTQRERWGKLRDVVRRLRARAEVGRDYHAASWRALELQLGLLGPIAGLPVEPTKRQLALASMRQRADAVLTAVVGDLIEDEEAAHQLRRLIGECDRWRGGGAWLRYQLAGLLERSGDVHEAYRHARLAREADPLNLHYHLLCRKLGAVVMARDAGLPSGERGQA
jgi:hypothetical protein